jgi:hypothetical protein
MENHIKGVRSAAFGIFLSSAVMAALITSIFSYQASRERRVSETMTQTADKLRYMVQG